MKNIFFFKHLHRTVQWFLYLLLAGTCHIAHALEIVDAAGHTVDVKVPVQRMVLLHSAAMELARVVGAEGLVVGVSDHIGKESAAMGYSDKVPSIGTWQEPDIEGIVKLKPDVLITYPGSASYLEARLLPFGIPVLRMDLYKINSMQKETAIFGKLIGKSAEAARFMAWQTGILQEVKSRVARLPAKATVYLESYADYRVAGSDSGLHQMCLTAGCVDIAANLPRGSKNVSPEWVVKQNPDVVIKMNSFTDEYTLSSAAPYNAVRDKITSRPLWHTLKAVHSGRVYVMESALFSTLRSTIGTVYLAKWLYPKEFADMQPDALHREYFQKFLHEPLQGYYFSDAMLLTFVGN